MTMMSTLAALQERFALPGLVEFEAGVNGLVLIVVSTPHAQAHVYLHGAHLTHYQPVGQDPILFLSRYSEFAPHKAIRGGVPVIFPWFGAKQDDPSAPSHGFARITDWEMSEVKANEDGSVTLVLRLTSNAATQAIWLGDWSLSYRVTMGESLHLELEAHNTGETTLQFEEALHTYFVVGEVSHVSVTGLGNTEYLDKVDGFQRKRQTADSLHIVGETDRVYVDTRTTCVIDDPDLGRRVMIAKNGSDATVVWNPGAAKAQALVDLGDQEWPHLLCVESGNIRPHTISLAAGASHRMSVTISTS